MNELERVARLAAARASAFLRDRWELVESTEHKSNEIDLVTEADRRAEALILRALRDAFPDHQILAEESGESGHGRIQWIVDPLDGTTNFAHRYPQISISIAARDLEDGRLLFGLVSDPIRGETFTACRGEGARLNGREIAVSRTSALGEALLATGFPYDRRERAALYLGFFRDFMERTQGLRRAGSAALDLAFVAAGRVDGFWEWGLQAWDVAAGALLVEEAGGRVTNLDGRAFDPFGGQILATNSALHDSMLAVIEERPPLRP